MNWGLATDTITLQANLRYKLVKAATAAEIATVNLADQITGAGLVMDWAFNKSYYDSTPINDGLSYYYAVLVKDQAVDSSGAQANNIAIYTPKPRPLRIFVTSSTTHGKIGSSGGIANADSFCMGDANYPGSGSYKALLSDGQDRIACANAGCSPSGAVDWVLKASTPYIRTDGTTITSTTSAAIFTFPFTHEIVTGGYSGIWTGLKADFTSSADNCLKWKSSTNPDVGANGIGNVTADTAINVGGSSACDTWSYPIYCVEQGVHE